MRALPLLLALLLGGASAFAVSCGGDRSGLIPADDAGRLTTALDQVAAATKAGDCEAAGQALSRARGAYNDLPTALDARLKRRLRSGLSNLRARVPVDCAKTTSTEAPPTTTEAPPAKTQSTQTESTPTQTTKTETTPTQPPQTETTPTTPTPTVPGDATGGTPGATP